MKRFAWGLVAWLTCISLGWSAPPVMPMPDAGAASTTPAPLPQNFIRIGGRPEIDLPGIISRTRNVFGVRLDGRNVLPSDDHATLSGKVIDLDHGTPVEDAIVLIYRTSDAPQMRRHDGTWYSMTIEPAGWVATNRDGTFTAQGLEPGTYHVEAYQPDTLLFPWLYESDDRLELQPGEHREKLVLKLYEGHVLTGTVREAETGEPIPGARMGAGRSWIVDPDERETIFAGGYQPITTDEDGRYTLYGVTGREVNVSAYFGNRHIQDEQGRRLHAIPVRTSGDVRTIELDFELFPAPSLTGIVRDSTGEPIGEGEVAWQSGNLNDYGRPTEPDWFPLSPQGEFELTVSQRSFGHVFIRTNKHPLAAFGTLQLQERLPDALEIRLPESASLDLLVQDHHGRGVEDAAVLLRRSGQGELPGPTVTYVRMEALHRYDRRATTEATGFVRIDDLTPGEYTLQVSAERHGGLAPSRDERLSLNPGQFEMKTVTLAPYQRYFGWVLDEGGAPIADARVSLSRLTPQSEPQATSTNSEGRFHFDRVSPPEMRLVHASHPEFHSRQLRDARLDGELNEIVLSRAESRQPTIHLTVRDDETGALVPNATITVLHSSSEVIVEESSPGEFVISNSRPTPMRFATVEAPGYAPTMIGSRPLSLDPLSTQDRVEIEVRMKRALHAAGRVIDSATGDPIRGVRIVAIVGAPRQVNFRDASGGSYSHYANPQEIETDADGRFLFEALPTPPEKRPLSPVGHNDMLFVIQPPAPWMEHDVMLSPTGGGLQDLGDVALTREGPVTVTVSRGGETVADAEVILDEGYVYLNRSNRQQHLRQRTGSDGSTTFPAVRARDLRVRVPSLMLEKKVMFDDSGTDREILVEAGTATLELTVSRHGVVASGDVTLTSADGWAAISEQGTRPALEPDSRGLIRVHSMPKGDWRLYISSVEGGTQSRSYRLHFDEGETRYVHAEMEHGGINARVVDANGQPVAGARFAILKREWGSRQPGDTLFDRVTSEEGSAVLHELPPGEYDLLAWRKQGTGPFEYFRARDFRVEPGQVTEAILHPEQNTPSLSVRVVDRETGSPIPDASVAASIGEYGFNTPAARMGPMGEDAVLENLPACGLMIRSWSGMYVQENARIDLTEGMPDSPLEMAMAQGGRLNWILSSHDVDSTTLATSVRDAATGPISSPIPRFFTVHPGRDLDASMTLAPGEYIVAAEVRGGDWVETRATITRGEVTTLRMEVEGVRIAVVEPAPLVGLVSEGP